MNNIVGERRRKESGNGFKLGTGRFRAASTGGVGDFGLWSFVLNINRVMMGEEEREEECAVDVVSPSTFFWVGGWVGGAVGLGKGRR